jgi:hypothetical protein
MTPRRVTRKWIRPVLCALLAGTWAAGALAGVPNKATQDSIVFRVAEDGAPYPAGKLSAGDKVEVIGFRPDFEWVRIRFESDEGYVQKESLSDLELPTREYFDPAAEKLGRRGNKASYSLAHMNARKRAAAKPAFSFLVSGQQESGLGIGGAAMYRSYSRAPTGFDLGLEGLLYLSTAGTPFSLSAFYRYWLGQKVKFGMEALASVTFVRVETNAGTGTATSSSLGVGAWAGISLTEKFVLTPGIRFAFVDGATPSYLLAGSWSL